VALDQTVAILKILLDGNGRRYSVPELQEAMMERYGITCHRKTIYANANAITLFYNLQTQKIRSGPVYYWIEPEEVTT
jgi:hypothetical protein